jgi:osmotically-inducible protein OsmY
MAITTRSSALQDLVESELGWDPQVTSAHIGVTSQDGVVTLSGFVPSFAERFAAEQAALRVRGTRAVANELVVKLLMDRIDPDIARDAADALRLNASVPATVKLTVSSGFITLTGSCEWWFQRKAAEDAVRHVPAILGVDNDIVIAPRVSASAVRTNIEDALRRSAEVDARQVEVRTLGNRVVLDGTVRSHAERIEAGRAAWAAPGVTAVENNLDVTP